MKNNAIEIEIDFNKINERIERKTEIWKKAARRLDRATKDLNNSLKPFGKFVDVQVNVNVDDLKKEGENNEESEVQSIRQENE